MTTPPTDHGAVAQLHLDHVDASRVALAAEYADENLRRRSVIADLHHGIGVDLKLADIHATLALRDEVATLVNDFRAVRGPVVVNYAGDLDDAGLARLREAVGR